tara:strand:- start:7 stop:153 length:147 start_codon:yes stop_codon:yes gene_type:complete
MGGTIMYKLIVLVAAVIVITTQWSAFTEAVDLVKMIEVTSEIITKVKE